MSNMQATWRNLLQRDLDARNYASDRRYVAAGTPEAWALLYAIQALNKELATDIENLGGLAAEW